jgi:hypothetical protein
MFPAAALRSGQIAFALLFVGIAHAPAQTNTARYRLSASAIKCIADHSKEIASSTSSEIILDISKCPPRGIQLESFHLSVQDSALPKAPVFTKEAEVADSILFIPQASLSCYIAKITSVRSFSQDPVEIDFSNCLK